MSKPQMSCWLVSLYCTYNDETQWPETQNLLGRDRDRDIRIAPRSRQDETLVRLETVSRPRRLDGDHISRDR